MKPTDKDAALLRDMLKACREALEFSNGVSLEQFVDNPKLCRAVERCLEIVGEAAGRVSPSFTLMHPEIAWHEIKGLRNLLAHEYGQIDYEILFKTLEEDVPLLVIQLVRIVEPDLTQPGTRERRGTYQVTLPVSGTRGGLAPGVVLTNKGLNALMDAEDIAKFRRLAGL